MYVFTMCLQCLERPEEASDLPEVELQAVAMWVLGIGFGSSGRAAHGLNHLGHRSSTHTHIT